MKKTKIAIILLMLTFIIVMAFIGKAQVISIRYYNINDAGTRMTITTDESGEPTREYRLSFEKDGKYLMGWRMLRELRKPNFPDVSFKSYIPILQSSYHYETDTIWNKIYHEDSTYFWVIENERIKVWDVTEEEVQAEWDAFNSAMVQYLTLMRKKVMADIPDGDNWRWERVDYSQPYSTRFSPMDVEKGKYNGQMFWVKSDREDLWDDFSYALKFKSNKFKALKSMKLTRW